MPDDRSALADEIAGTIAELQRAEVPRPVIVTALGLLVLRQQDTILAALRHDAGAAMRERCIEAVRSSPAEAPYPAEDMAIRRAIAAIRSLPLSDTKGDAP